MLKKIGFIGLLGVLLVSMSGFTPVQQATPTPAPASGAATAHITQVDTSQFPKVTVYVSVTDEAGEPVGVSPSRIVLKENGEQITPEQISGSGDIGPLSTLLVMDVSGSMNRPGKLTAAKDAALAYVDQARPDDLIGLLAFNTKVDYVQPLTEDRAAIIKAIKGLKALDDTAMYDALAWSMQILESVTGRKAVIVMTDGLDNRSKTAPQQLIQMVAPQGLSISTIGFGDPSQSKGSIDSLDETGLKALAEMAGGAYGFANDAESLRLLYERYGRALQSEYTFTYTTPSTLRDGINRSLSVEVSETGGAAAPVAYNPGGLVPEVAQNASWVVFLLVLGGLVLLLFVPLLLGKVFSFVRPRSKSKPASAPKTSRIKLKS